MTTDVVSTWQGFHWRLGIIRSVTRFLVEPTRAGWGYLAGVGPASPMWWAVTVLPVLVAWSRTRSLVAI